MSDAIFREREVQVGDETILLRKQPIDKIFQFGSQPYVIIGISGSGKTTLSLHLIYRYARECTKLYYVSATTAKSFDSTNDAINKIPACFRRQPTFESINAIWDDIIEENKATSASAEEYEQLILKLWGDNKDAARSTIKYIKSKCDEVYTQQLAYYKRRGESEDTAQKNANRDQHAMRCSCLSLLVADSVSQKGNAMLSEHELLVVNSLISKKPKTLLILDDVTAELENMKLTNSRLVKYQGRSIKVNTAYELLITDILTRGRHYNCLIALFIHDINVIKKSQIQNIIVFDSMAAQTLQLSRTISRRFLNALTAISPILFTSEFEHYFIYGKLQENQICVGKADLCSGTIELSSGNRALVKAYEEIAKLNENDEVPDDDYDVKDSDNDSDEESDDEN